MKTIMCRPLPPVRPSRWLAPALLGLGLLLPGQSVGQASNNCNLLPNPSFEQQNVAQLSGQPDNVSSPNSRYNELTGWRFALGQSSGPSNNGKPTYYATNAPAGSATNPFTNPALVYLGSPFTPYNYNPALHNGTLSLLSAVNGTQSPFYAQDIVTATSTSVLTIGTYYASFLAYRSAAGPATPLGMGFAPVNTTYSSSTGTFIQSNGDLTNSAWTRVAGQFTIPSNYPTSEWSVFIGNINSVTGTSRQARYYIDEVELYKIPTAGPSVSCASSNVVIGEGCPIPGATYAWRVSGQSAVFATTLTTTVSPTSATYTLTVTLPDYSTKVSSVTVNPRTPPAPTATQLNPAEDNCYAVAHFIIDNFNPAFTYTINRGAGNPLPNPLHPTSPQFSLKISGPSAWPAYASFTITAVSNCSPSVSTTSEVIGAEFICEEIAPTGRLAAYPNPASESLTVPAGTQDATLLNSQGKAVARPDAAGKLDVRKLPAGLYNLQTRQKDKLVNQRIEVKH